MLTKNALACMAFFYMVYCWWIHEADHPRGFNHVEYQEVLDDTYEKGMERIADMHIPVYGYRPDENGRLETYEITKRPEPKPTPQKKVVKKEEIKPVVAVVNVATPKPKPKPTVKPVPVYKPTPAPIVKQVAPPEPVQEVDPEVPPANEPMGDEEYSELHSQDKDFLDNNTK